MTQVRARAGSRMARAAEEEARLLFGGRWMPLTRALTFIEGTLDEVVEAWMGWRGTAVLNRTGYPMRVRPIRGDLEQQLRQLLPFVGPMSRKTLFTPTADPIPDAAVPGGPWVCVLNDNWVAGGAKDAAGGLTPRGLRAITVESSPSSLDVEKNTGFYGLHRLGVHWHDPTEKFGTGGRSIGIAQFENIRTWNFVDHGEPLPFEDTRHYTAKKVQDCFTQQLLIRYCAALGLRPFDADFYAPDRVGVLIEDTSPPLKGAWQGDLAARRSGRPVEEIGQPIPRPEP